MQISQNGNWLPPPRDFLFILALNIHEDVKYA